MKPLKHLTFTTTVPEAYKVAILIKEQDLTKHALTQHYVEYLTMECGIPLEEIIVIGLPYKTYKKAPNASEMKLIIPELQTMLDSAGVVQVLVCDTPYFKRFVGITKVSNLAGILLANKFGSQRIFKGIHYRSFTFAPKTQSRLQLSMDALGESYAGTYATPDIIKEELYPTTYLEIKDFLDKLLEYPTLAVDIEGFGLGLTECGIASICFVWSDCEGGAFLCDYQRIGEVGKPNVSIRKLIYDFFIRYRGEAIYHGVSFDVKQLVANLFMDNDLLDIPNLNFGLEVLLKNHYCTKDMTYLAVNSAEGNNLKLKYNTLEYSGDYAIDVKDITVHEPAVILQYNLIDGLNTFWLYTKRRKDLEARGLWQVYLDTFRQNQVMLISVELHGMPLNMPVVLDLITTLEVEIDKATAIFDTLPAVKEFVDHKGIVEHCKYQQKVKGQGRTLDNYLDWKPATFLPSSGANVTWILHELYDLPVINRTKTGLPSADGDTLKAHLAALNEKGITSDVVAFLEAMILYLKVAKIIDFPYAFLKYSILKKDGVYYLHGSFNQGGTISTRLSSSQPKL